MWVNDVLVTQVYSTHHSENAWGNITGRGWIKIRGGASDGVTNMFYLLSSAKANGRKVNVYIVDNLIERAYML